MFDFADQSLAVNGPMNLSDIRFASLTSLAKPHPRPDKQSRKILLAQKPGTDNRSNKEP
jgi:hypothetical protein